MQLRLHPRDAEELTAIAHQGGIAVEQLAAQVLVDWLHRRRSVAAGAAELRS